MIDALFGLAARIASEVLPFAGVIILGGIAWKFWLHYIRQDFISGITYVMLEVVPPREVLRSPKAMELFLTNALYHYSNKGGKEEYWQGAVWFWHSLEIVSIEGQVHFYIRTPTRLKEYVETQMYAQYPQAQIRVVEDYTLAVDEITPQSDWNLWGCEFQLEKPEAYPIKTYVDYGLDKDPDEEFKVDPLSPVVELFGSIKKGEQMWVQFVVRPSKVEYHTHGTWFGKHDWVAEAQNEIEKLMEKYALSNLIEGSTEKKTRPPYAMEPTIKGMTTKITKLGFDTGIRVCYVAKKDAWDLNNRRNIRMIFRQYNNPLVNSLVRKNSTQADAFGSIFTISPEKVMVLSNRMLTEYRERSFFYLPMRHHLAAYLPWPISPTLFMKYFHPHTMVLNVEELATLWHFPGQILKVPTLERIESKEAAPPTNLPL